MIRGIDGVRIFLDVHDYQDFVGRLVRVLAECGAFCFAWALMPNHVHLALRTAQGELSRLMRRLCTGHALRLNRRWGRRGYVFQNRFLSRIVTGDADLIGLLRYVHRNPLEAGLVASLEELAHFPWSGHAALVGARPPLDFETVSATLELFDDDPTTARRELLDWMGVPVAGDPAGPETTDAGPSKTAAGAPPAAFDALAQGGLEALMRSVCARYGVPEAELRSRLRRPAITRARAVTAYWATVRLRIPGRVVAAALGVTPAAVSMALDRGRRAVLADDFAFAPAPDELRQPN
jgi:REP element-mobilizing transposase RayT